MTRTRSLGEDLILARRDELLLRPRPTIRPKTKTQILPALFVGIFVYHMLSKGAL